MSFKPMLAAKAVLSNLRYPVCASYKVDGIRATIHDGIAYSRSMKEIPNNFIQEWVFNTPALNGMDGEMVIGMPNEPDTFRRSTSVIMSDDALIGELTFHVFDLHNLPAIAYMGRWRELRRILRHRGGLENVAMLDTVLIEDQARLEQYEALALSEGFEGIMTRDPEGLYKQGRSTAREQGLLKVKRHEDCECVIIGSEERQHNANDAFTNELGRTARSSAKGGKRGMGTLGALIVHGCPGTPYEGIEFSVGTGMDDYTRAELWKMRKMLPGRIVRVKYFPMGSKDKPRFPVFQGFRDERDTDLILGNLNPAPATVEA